MPLLQLLVQVLLSVVLTLAALGGGAYYAYQRYFPELRDRLETEIDKLSDLQLTVDDLGGGDGPTASALYDRSRAGWLHVYSTGMTGAGTGFPTQTSSGHHAAWDPTWDAATVGAALASPAAEDDLPLDGFTFSDRAAFRDYSLLSGTTDAAEAFTLATVNPVTGGVPRWPTTGPQPVGLTANHALTALVRASVALSVNAAVDVWVALLQYTPNGTAFDYALVGPPLLQRVSTTAVTVGVQGAVRLAAGEGVLLAFGCTVPNSAPGVHGVSLLARQVSSSQVQGSF